MCVRERMQTSYKEYKICTEKMLKEEYKVLNRIDNHWSKRKEKYLQKRRGLIFVDH